MPKNYLILIMIIFLELFIIFYLFQRIDQINLNFGAIKEEHNLPLYPINGFITHSNNPDLIYQLKPNHEQMFDGLVIKLDRVTHIKINSDGLRDKEYPLNKSNNTFRIVILGDSQTFGLGIELEESYTEILESKLNKLDNGINYEILNFGVSGYNTWQEVEMFKIKGLKYKPDMVIVGYTQDDIKDHFLYDKIYRDISKKYSNNFQNEEVIKIMLEADHAIFEGPFKKSFEENQKMVLIPLESLSNITLRENITVVIAVIALIPQDQLNFLKQIVKEKNWYLIEVNEIISNYKYGELIIHPQDVHWNPIANEIIGAQIYNYLIENQLIPITLEELKNFQSN